MGEKNKKKLTNKQKGILVIIGAGATIITVKAVRAIIKKKTGVDTGEVIEMKERDKLLMAVDEDIFSDLAPTLENVIIDQGIEKVNISRCYDIGDNVHKCVEITMDTIVGD